MSDPTEAIRRQQVKEINSNPSAKEMLEAKHGVGNVWTTSELQMEFQVLAFLSPFCVVERKSDRTKGSVQFQHDPRLYYSFEPE